MVLVDLWLRQNNLMQKLAAFSQFYIIIAQRLHATQWSCSKILSQYHHFQMQRSGHAPRYCYNITTFKYRCTVKADDKSAKNHDAEMKA